MQRNFLEIARLERNSSESRKDSVPPAHLFSPPMRPADHATTLPSERNRPAPIDTSEETLAAAIRNVSPAQEALSPKTRTRCEHEQMIFNNSPQGSCSTRSLLAQQMAGQGLQYGIGSSRLQQMIGQKETPTVTHPVDLSEVS